MTGSDADRDGPPVFLPEPARPDPPPEPDLTDRTDPPPASRGQRLDPAQDRPQARRGPPAWALWLGLVATLALSISEGSPIPFLMGAAAFYLFRRRGRP